MSGTMNLRGAALLGLSLFRVTSAKVIGYTAVAGEAVPCDTTSGTFAVTLPDATACAGQWILVFDQNGGANFRNITFLMTSSQKVNGSNSPAAISTSYGSALFISDGANWVRPV